MHDIEYRNELEIGKRFDFNTISLLKIIETRAGLTNGHYEKLFYKVDLVNSSNL